MNTTESVVFTYDQFCNKSAIDPVEIITLVKLNESIWKIFDKYKILIIQVIGQVSNQYK